MMIRNKEKTIDTYIKNSNELALIDKTRLLMSMSGYPSKDIVSRRYDIYKMIREDNINVPYKCEPLFYFYVNDKPHTQLGGEFVSDITLGYIKDCFKINDGIDIEIVSDGGHYDRNNSTILHKYYFFLLNER
tara:strand:- start:158 stop:553 length:396 start_codon:yes stop_codon:yes gene_type:complete